MYRARLERPLFSVFDWSLQCLVKANGEGEYIWIEWAQFLFTGF